MPQRRKRRPRVSGRMTTPECKRHDETRQLGLTRNRGWRGRSSRRSLLFNFCRLREHFGMQLASKIFDHRNDAGRRTIDGIIGDRETTIAYGIKELPARAIRERFKIVSGRTGVRSGEDQVIGLQTHNLFKVHLRPILIRIDNGNRAGFVKRVGDESILSDRHERIRPDNKKHAARRHRAKSVLQGGQPLLKILVRDVPAAGTFSTSASFCTDEIISSTVRASVE